MNSRLSRTLIYLTPIFWVLLIYGMFSLLSLSPVHDGNLHTLFWYSNASVAIYISTLRVKQWPVLVLPISAVLISANVFFEQSFLTSPYTIPAHLTELFLMAYGYQYLLKKIDAFSTFKNTFTCVLAICFTPACLSSLVYSGAIMLTRNIDISEPVMWLGRSVASSFSIALVGLYGLNNGFKQLITEIIEPKNILTFGTTGTVAVASVYFFDYPYVVLTAYFIGIALFNNIGFLAANFCVSTLALNMLSSLNFVVIEGYLKVDFIGLYFPLFIVFSVVGLFGVVLLVERRLSSENTIASDRYLEMYRKTPALMYSIDREGNIVFVSNAWLKLFGYQFEEVVGRRPVDFLTDDSKKYAFDIVLPKLYMQGFCDSVRFDMKKKSGEVINVELSAILQRDSQGAVQSSLTFLKDVTLEQQLRHQLRSEKDLLEVTLSSIADGIVSTDAKGTVTYLNPAAEKLIGLELSRVVGQPFEDVVLLFDEDNNRRLDSPVIKCLETKEIQETPQNALLRSHSGIQYLVKDSVAPIMSKEGGLLGTVLIIQDNTEGRKTTQKMSYMAQHDALTDLPNRVLLLDRLKQHCVTSLRTREKFSLVFLDIDNFKMVNDSMGHNAGDQLLKIVSSRLKTILRESDTISRLGGDEFVMILNSKAGGTETAVVCEKVIKEIKHPVVLSNQEIQISVSLGIAEFPDDGDTPDILMRRADAAMYRSKKDGRDIFTFYSQDIEENVQQRLKLENDLRVALRAERIFMMFQPIVEYGSSNYDTFESLVRWKNDGQFVSPEKFISIAEETSLIRPLGYYIMEKVLQSQKYWKEEYGYRPTLTINLSSKQIEDSDFTENVRNLFKKYGTDPKKIIFEITESALMTDPERALEVIQDVKNMNVRIAIDDFGTGYSSLSYLKRFPVDVLKIDRAFVNDIDKDVKDKEFIQLIVSLGQNLDLKLVAEGVETECQAKLLEQMGCVYHQGYLYSKPMLESDVVECFKRDNSKVSFLEGNRKD